MNRRNQEATPTRPQGRGDRLLREPLNPQGERAFFSPEHNAWLERLYGWPAGSAIGIYQADAALREDARRLIDAANMRTPPQYDAVVAPTDDTPPLPRYTRDDPDRPRLPGAGEDARRPRDQAFRDIARRQAFAEIGDQIRSEARLSVAQAFRDIANERRGGDRGPPRMDLIRDQTAIHGVADRDAGTVDGTQQIREQQARRQRRALRAQQLAGYLTPDELQQREADLDSDLDQSVEDLNHFTRPGPVDRPRTADSGFLRAYEPAPYLDHVDGVFPARLPEFQATNDRGPYEPDRNAAEQPPRNPPNRNVIDFGAIRDRARTAFRGFPITPPRALQGAIAPYGTPRASLFENVAAGPFNAVLGGRRVTFAENLAGPQTNTARTPPGVDTPLHSLFDPLPPTTAAASSDAPTVGDAELSDEPATSANNTPRRTARRSQESTGSDGNGESPRTRTMARTGLSDSPLGNVRVTRNMIRNRGRGGTHGRAGARGRGR